MHSISRILVPVDFSDRSLSIIHPVRAIASKCQAEVVLLHVVNPFIMIPATAISGPTLIPVSQDEVEARTKRLEGFAREELRGLTVQRTVYQGDPASQIVSSAGEGIGLIALPTHGYGPVRQFLLGSVAAKVLHDAACPVLTLAHSSDKTSERPHHEPELRRVLCAVDLEPDSARVLRWAAEFARTIGASFGMAHAITPPHPNLAVLLSPDFGVRLSEIVRDDLDKLQKSAGVEAAAIYTAEGDVAPTVRSLAEQSKADVVVIGRGRGEAGGGRLGANAYAMTRQMRCPLISV